MDNLCGEVINKDANNSSFSSSAPLASSDYNKEDFRVVEEKEECCLNDMVGNRILPVGNLAKVLLRDTCYQNFTAKNH